MAAQRYGISLQQYIPRDDIGYRYIILRSGIACFTLNPMHCTCIAKSGYNTHKSCSGLC